MDAIFKINKVGVSSISVLGLELDNDEYLKEDGVLVSTRSYAFSHSVTLNVMSNITTTGVKNQTYSINLHKTGCIDENVFVMSEDGLIEVNHMIIPNDVWLNYLLANDVQALNRYDSIVYYDTPSGTFKMHIDNLGTPPIDITIEDILKEEYLPTSYVTSVIRADKNTFNMYYLKTAYNRVSSDYLNTLLHRPMIGHQLKLLKESADCLLMCMKCVTILIEDLQLYEAQVLLEDVQTITARMQDSNPLIKHGSY